MANMAQLFVTVKDTILETMRIIDENAQQIAIVVDENKKFLGTVTDGDIRRAILQGTKLEDEISKVVNFNPVFVTQHDSAKKILRLFRKYNLKQIPVINEHNEVIELVQINRFLSETTKNNLVVLMAGGLGTRLRPLTETIPKPLLKVGDKAILETILDSFIDQGFYRFALTVNYKSEMIEEYFGDGSRWGVEITYIHEEKRLGTAGALSLLATSEKEPLIVMNGDLLTKVNFNQLLDFHKENEAWGTMCVRQFEYQVPYGVINTDGHQLLNIEEKPIHKFFVNAGIYAVSPQAVALIPYNEFYDMPTLFNELVQQEQVASVFPIREYWMDIGQMKDFEQAQLDFGEVFSRD